MGDRSEVEEPVDRDLDLDLNLRFSRIGQFPKYSRKPSLSCRASHSETNMIAEFTIQSITDTNLFLDDLPLWK